MVDQILSGQLSKQLIHDLDCSIALNKGFVMNYDTWLLKLNSSKHINEYSFLLKINDLFTSITLMEFY